MNLTFEFNNKDNKISFDSTRFISCPRAFIVNFGHVNAKVCLTATGNQVKRPSMH